MLEKGLKRHLSSPGRKQYPGPSYLRDPPRPETKKYGTKNSGTKLNINRL